MSAIDKLKEAEAAISIISVLGKMGGASLAIGGIGIALTAVVAAVTAYKTHMENLRKEAEAGASTFRQSQESLDGYVSKIQELKDALDEGSLTEAEAYDAKKQLFDIQTQLNNSYGDAASGIDLVNGKLDEQIAKVRELSALDANRFLNEQASGIRVAEREMTKTLGGEGNFFREPGEYIGMFYENAEDSTEKLKEILRKYSNFETDDMGDGSVRVRFVGDATQAKSVLNDFMTDMREAEKEFGDASIFQDMFDGASIVYKEADSIITNYKGIYEEAMRARMVAESSMTNPITYSGGGQSKTAAKWLDDYTSSIQSYNDALISGDTSKIADARSEFEGLDATIKSLLSESDGFSYFAPMFTEVRTALNESAVAAQKFKEIMTGDKNAESLKNSGMTETQFASAFVEGLKSDQNSEAIRSVIRQYAKIYGTEFGDITVDQVEMVAGYLADIGVLVRDTVSDTVTASLHDVKKVAEDTTATISSISNVQKILASQGAGKSLSVEDFTSEDMKDFASTLEYVNGIYQLNVEKVNELVEAKAAEQISVNDTNKAYAQMKYIENAKKIDELSKSLADAKKGLDGNADAIEKSIEALRKENLSLISECQQYDMLSVSLRNAASAYQHWVNSRSSSDYGDLFDGTMLAVDEINNTFTTGNFGSLHYKAALDLVVPEDVDKEDIDQVKAYVDKLSRYLTSENGKVTGLNMSNFLQDAKAAGLMGYDASSDYWSIKPGVKLEDFSRELDLADGMVSAFFDELSLKGGDFSFGDEITQTFGDLAVKAYEAKTSLQDAFGDQYEVKIDVSDAGSTEEQIRALEATIAKMDSLKAEPDIDASQIEDANDIIQYCVRQIQLLNEPAIMKVDTSAVQGSVGEAIDLLQQFQELNDIKEAILKVDVSADISNIDKQISDIAQQIQTNEVIKADLQINTTSVDSIKSSIGDIDIPALVKLLPDPSAIEGYNPDTKQVDVIYNPNDDALPESFDDVSRTVNYIPNTSRLPNTLSTITRYVNYVKTGDIEGDGELHGTAHAYGTARANGDWGTARGGKTLVGELGREIVVDTRTGKWYTVGDNGAEFRNIPAGAIVFNHKQTESLFENGYAIGRARALATGTAMVSGGISGGFVNYQPSPNPGYRNPSSGANSSIENNYDKELETFDWIEIAIDRIRRVIERLGKTADSVFKSLRTRLSATDDEITAVTREIGIQWQAYEKYMSAAEAVNLSSDLKQLVRSGAIDISQYDQDTQKLINDYKDLYEKALDCADAVDDLHENLAELYKSRFDNIQKDFENKIALMEKSSDAYNRKIDMLEEHGYLQNADYYKKLQDNERTNITTLNKELASLQAAMAQAMASGEIEEGSEAWYEMKLSIEDVKASIEDAELAIIKYDNTMRQISWDYFDYAQERVGQITSEADFLLNLLDGKDMYDENGNLSDNGIATAGLRAEKYGVYMAQADKYAEEIKRINKELADDPNNTKLIKRRDELLASQRDAILAAKSEKEAMVSLVAEGINVELDAIKRLIDAYTESLDSAKDLYEYQKKIADKTENITELEKQLAAYQNDMSEETRAKIQKIEVELKNAREDLKDTEYDRFVSDTKKTLDSLYSEYEEILNSRFDDAIGTFERLIDLVNDNYIDINEYISKEAAAVGYAITEATNSIWANGGGVNGLVSEYGTDVTTKLTAVGLTVENIFGVLEEIARANGVAFTGKSYSSGGLVDYTGIANVHGSSDKPELVLDAEDTKNFLLLRDALRNMSDDSLRGYGSIIMGDAISQGVSKSTRLVSGGNIGDCSVGSINVTIPIEHVEDYNDFVNQLKNDRQFEQMIQSMTIGRIAGKSSLEKNKYKW